MLGDAGWYVLSAILVLALCSLITRAGYMVFGDYLPLPEGVRRALRYAPAAALTGIIVPEVLPWQAGAWPTLDVKAAAALLAILLYWRTRNSLLVIAGGMVAYWLLRPWWPF
ncbi:MAG: AzlD domain-containing protein [Alcaligenaceae bacterium]|nr:AzlD domain-containing protein [Alcaligenaceae bacterium]